MEQKNFKKQAMIQALTGSLGIVTTACKEVGIDRSTHYGWMKTDPEYQREAEETAEVALDYVEGKLYELIDGVILTSAKGITYQKEPNIRAIMFYLKTKGKKRGYVERAEKGQMMHQQGLMDRLDNSYANLPVEPQQDEPVIEHPVVDDSHLNNVTVTESKTERKSLSEAPKYKTVHQPVPHKLIGITHLPEYPDFKPKPYSQSTQRWVSQTVWRP